MEVLSRRDREKKTREAEIVQAAEEIFRQKGYENTSMEDIATKAQFTKRTLYQYFPSKESLFFAVIRKGFEQFQRFLTIEAEPGLSGYERLAKVSKSVFQFFEEYPEFFKLLNYVGYARQNSEPVAGTQSLSGANDTMFELLSSYIAAGQQDGSVTRAIDARMTAISTVFLTTAFFNQLAVTGATFTTHFNVSLQDFSDFTMDLILRNIKNQ